VASAGEGDAQQLPRLTYDEEPWRYTHAPLDVQLEEQGVRQFELDVWSDVGGGAGRFRVTHIPVLDQGTTCERLTGCLRVMREWSDEHERHQPIVVLIEPKNEVAEENRAAYFADLEGRLPGVRGHGQ
jgi:hypothetical protein